MNPIPGRDLQQLDSEEMPDMEEMHGLPSFPDSPMKKGFSQAAIKDAVSSKEPEENIAGPSEAKNIKIVEIDDNASPRYSPGIAPIIERSAKAFSSSMASRPSDEEISEPVIPEPYSPPAAKFEPKSSDIFVKMEKFYSAKRALSSTQDQLNSIESVLKKIRETKLREEQELAAWEKEIMQAKSRIQEITKNIFEKT